MSHVDRPPLNVFGGGGWLLHLSVRKSRDPDVPRRTHPALASHIVVGSDQLQEGRLRHVPRVGRRQQAEGVRRQGAARAQAQEPDREGSRVHQVARLARYLARIAAAPGAGDNHQCICAIITSSRCRRMTGPRCVAERKKQPESAAQYKTNERAPYARPVSYFSSVASLVAVRRASGGRSSGLACSPYTPGRGLVYFLFLFLNFFLQEAYAMKLAANPRTPCPNRKAPVSTRKLADHHGARGGGKFH